MEDKDRYVRDPHPHDILTSENGRKVQANHKGNVQFLKLLVSDHNDPSRESDGRAPVSARESAKRVIDKIKSRSPPGRFLKRVEIRDAGEGKPPPLLSSGEDRAAPRSKRRWKIMSREDAILTTLIYLQKVKEELKKQRRRKKNLRKRSLSYEEQTGGETASGNSKKTKIASIEPMNEIDDPEIIVIDSHEVTSSSDDAGVVSKHYRDVEQSQSHSVSSTHATIFSSLNPSYHMMYSNATVFHVCTI